jgi:hypothetical protein
MVVAGFFSPFSFVFYSVLAAIVKHLSQQWCLARDPCDMGIAESGSPALWLSSRLPYI